MCLFYYFILFSFGCFAVLGNQGGWVSSIREILVICCIYGRKSSQEVSTGPKKPQTYKAPLFYYKSSVSLWSIKTSLLVFTVHLNRIMNKEVHKPFQVKETIAFLIYCQKRLYLRLWVEFKNLACVV